MSILGLLAVLGEGLGWVSFGDVRGGSGLSLGEDAAASVGFTSSSLELIRLLEWRIESIEKERGFEAEGMGEGCGRGKRGRGMG